MPIQIERHEEHESTRLVVRGDIDLTTAEELEQAVLRAQSTGLTVLLDLSSVEFMDSTGLQILLDADVRARQHGSDLVVLAGDGEAARVMALAQVTDRLHVTSVE